MTRAAFLDRDGVINAKAREGSYIAAWADFEFLPGVAISLRALREAGFRLVVVTNQRGIARGVMSRAGVDRIHEQMSAELAEAGAPVDAVFVCPHDEGTCQCRKPGTALFARAIERFPDISLSGSIVIGDSIGDLEAGNCLGCPTFLVGTRERVEAVERSAAQRGIVIDGVAASLLDLVTNDPRLREILTGRQTA